MNFDILINRRGTNCVKWDTATEEDVIPMWVADMDFKTAPCITEAIARRVSQGIFGYTIVPDSYYEAIIKWFDKRHGWNIGHDWIIYTSGVVPAISATIKALTSPGDKVLIQTPVYNCFFSSIRNNGCEIIENPLVYENNEYNIDFDDFEKKAADKDVKVFLLCNPHNPAGRVWKRQELERMNQICTSHGVKVISDEIHCELVMPGHEYTPFASVSEECLNNSVVLNSPSKAFNTAGLQIANIISNNKNVRKKINRAININEICDVNPFGVIALQAAYNDGGEWLDCLKAYLYDNYMTLCDFFKRNIPEIGITHLEGTYLVWADIRKTGITSDTLTSMLLKEGRVMVNSGTMYGEKAGEGFIRINIACPRSRMLEGLKRIAGVVGNISRD